LAEIHSAQDIVGWPGGWYLYENGQVRGPLAADEAFAVPDDKDSSGKQRLVSRKGFTQWYPVRDLAEVYKLASNAGTKSADEMTRLKAQLAAIQAEPAPTAQPRVEKRNLAPSAKSADPGFEPFPTHDSTFSDLTEATLAPTMAKKGDLSEVEAVIRELEAQPPAIPAAVTAPMPESGIEQVPAPTRSPLALLQHEYFLVKGRLRLGRVRNPWSSGIFGFVMTLGAYWFIWVNELAKEIRFHSNPEANKSIPTFLAFIPIVHIYGTFRLAAAMRDLERENKYENTIPWLAAVLSVIPPLAIVYLQDCANAHWWLHVRHELASKNKRR
jgi:hypothetical protein